MNPSSEKKIMITGASGLLGRSVFKLFVKEGWDVYGIAFTRVDDHLHKVDITHKEEIRKAIHDFRPGFVIHSAAQRFPDKVDSNPEAASILNVDATRYIVDAAAEVEAPVLYVSTDYVFDGKADRPYTPEDEPRPVNLYGKTKLEGEVVTLRNPDNLVLRVPVLYGPVTTLKESAVTCLLEPLLNSDNVANISHLERRCPSHVDDIALLCFQLASAQKENRVNGVFQWCGEEKMTKYEMTLKIAEIFKLLHSHVKPDTNQVSSTTRPFDTELDRSRLVQLGFGKHTAFSQGVKEALSQWVQKVVVTFG